LLEDLERQIVRWIDDIQAAAQALFDAIAAIAQEITQLIELVQARLGEALDILENTLRQLDRPSGRARVLDKLGLKAGDEVVAALRANFLYRGLSHDDKATARRLARSAAREFIDNEFVDFIVAAIADVGDDLSDFL